MGIFIVPLTKFVLKSYRKLLIFPSKYNFSPDGIALSASNISSPFLLEPNNRLLICGLLYVCSFLATSIVCWVGCFLPDIQPPNHNTALIPPLHPTALRWLFPHRYNILLLTVLHCPLPFPFLFHIQLLS